MKKSERMPKISFLALMTVVASTLPKTAFQGNKYIGDVSVYCPFNIIIYKNTDYDYLMSREFIVFPDYPSNC